MTRYFHSYREIQETQARNYKLEAYKAIRASYRKSRQIFQEEDHKVINSRELKF